METIVQFLARGDVFMARGQRHIIKHVFRQVDPDPINALNDRRQVLAVGEDADGKYWEATFDWGETVDTLDGVTL